MNPVSEEENEGTNARMLHVAPISLTGDAKMAYILLSENIRRLYGLGEKVPCTFDPLMWDIEESKRRTSVIDRQKQRQTANLAARQCRGHCKVLELCVSYKETGAIRSGVLAGEWLGARQNRNKKRTSFNS